MAETLLTMENAHRVAECVDKDGDTWVYITATTNWRCAQLQRTTKAIIDYWGPLRITRWKPGMEPATSAAEKWAVGYVLRNGDEPPAGTVIESPSGMRVVCGAYPLGPITEGVWRVIVPPPAPPPPKWQPRLVWMKGEGTNAHTESAAHRPPSRDEMRELLGDGWLDYRYYDRILDAFYGKEPTT